EQAVADELVVEAQRVVAGHAGARARHLVLDARERLGLIHALALRLPGINAGDHAGPGGGQHVVRGPDHEVDGFLDLSELQVGADGGELGDAAQPRVAAPGLQVVEEVAVSHYRDRGPPMSCGSSGSTRSSTLASSASQSIPSSAARPRVASSRISCCTFARSSATA